MTGLPGDWRYGDFWWPLPSRKAYMAVGYLGQVIMVLPELNIVAAMTGSLYNQRLDRVIDHIERAVRSRQPQPPDAEGVALLQDEVAGRLTAS
jgi:CubicO group peptidase (beta-lactamase class C family)